MSTDHIDGAELLDLLTQAAAGRREYAANAPDPARLILEQEAATLDAVARLVSGDRSVMLGWLPSWRWPDGWERLYDRNANKREAGTQ